MKVVGYISSYRSQDLDRSLELKIQKDQIEEFCSKYGFELIKVFEEPPDSRADYRPELINLINQASQNHIDKVIVLKLDRFGHDNTLIQWVKDELKKYKTDIYSLTESKLEDTIKNKTVSPELKIKRIQERVRDIPSLPEVVNKIIELVQDPKSSAAQLSRVIAHDPGLTSRVLRLVNSAYYGFPKQISSIQHAIMILGFTTMRGLVLSSSIFKIFSPKNDGTKTLDYKKFWKHSLITAIASKHVNRHLYLKEDDDIFSAAILHDIGKIILDQYDHSNYIKVLQEAPDSYNSSKVLWEEAKYCEITHPEIGNLIAEGWNLPEDLADVILFHHNPLKAEKNTRLTSIVYLGNIISHMALDFEKFDLNFFDNKVLEYLGLSEDDVITIYNLTIEEIENIGELESFFK